MNTELTEGEAEKRHTDPDNVFLSKIRGDLTAISTKLERQSRK